MKPAGVRSSIYINFFSGNHDKDPKFEVDDQVRIWKFKNVFEKCYISNWSFLKNVTFQIDLKRFLWLIKLKYCSGDKIENLNCEKIVGTYYENDMQK